MCQKDSFHRKEKEIENTDTDNAKYKGKNIGYMNNKNKINKNRTYVQAGLVKKYSQ